MARMWEAPRLLEEIKLKCPRCLAVYSRGSDLQRHLEKKHDPREARRDYVRWEVRNYCVCVIMYIYPKCAKVS